jgi:hypothetical protein
VVEISTSIPQAQTFRFGHGEFVPIAMNGWTCSEHIIDPAKRITTKFKSLRKELKVWKSSLPKLAIAIEKIKVILHFLETIELFRDLSLAEWNFRNLVS